ncbi:MAG TPA: LCP family protein, partial [Anaerolineales bacterium]
MKRFLNIMLLAGFLLGGCGVFAPRPPSAQAALPFALVTAAPNASPTPTPFQPIPLSPTATIPPSPTPDPFTPTPTVPPPTETPLPTIDPNILVNTLVPFSTIEASGNSQILNNGQETVNFLLIGSDRRSGTSFRTDTMVIAILRPNEGQVSLISIPRDLWVSIPESGNQRINTAYQRGI